MSAKMGTSKTNFIHVPERIVYNKGYDDILVMEIPVTKPEPVRQSFSDAVTNK